MNSYNCYSCAVPSLVCDMAESTANGGIMIYWRFIHTGGLNITSINITYTINNQATIQYGPDVDVNDTAAFIPSLIAGYSYVATVAAENSVGSTSVGCPSVELSYGKYVRYLLVTYIIRSLCYMMLSQHNNYYN